MFYLFRENKLFQYHLENVHVLTNAKLIMSGLHSFKVSLDRCLIKYL